MDTHKFEDDNHCQGLSQWTDQKRQEDFGEMVVSSIDCVRRCAQQSEQSELNEKCLYVRVTQQSLDAGDKLVCQMFFLDGDGMSQVDLLTVSYTFYNKVDFKAIQAIYPPICYAEKNETSTSMSVSSSHVDEDHEIPPNNWEVYISTDEDYSRTQNPTYIRNNNGKGLYYKFLFLDHLDVYTVVTSSYWTMPNGNFYTQALDLMEKNKGGFVKDSAKRCMYTGVYNGRLFTVTIDPDGSYSETVTEPQKLQIFREIDSRYNISPVTEEIDETKLRSYLEQGFSVFNEKTTIVWDNGKISLNRMNNHIYHVKVNEFGRMALPPEYLQQTSVYNDFRQKARQQIGVPGGTIRLSLHSPSSFLLNRHWVSIFDTMPTKDTKERLMAVVEKIQMGHLIRVRFNNIYHGVEDLLVFEDDIYFIVSQQLTVNDKLKYTNDSYGIRGVVTMGGNYFKCSHFFEGKSFEDQPEIEQVKGEVQVFADTRSWVSIFSIIYDGINGRLISGNASHLANYALEGRDMNILLLYEDTARFLRIQLLTVHNFNSESVLVSGESYVTWNLIPIENNLLLSMNDACDMEKVLVRLNGEVQVFVYNNPTRYPVKVLKNVQSTWYIN